MAHYVGETYRDSRVEVDGHTYERCTFVNCTFVFHGREKFFLKNNAITTCTWEFADAAALTLTALSMLYQGGFADVVDATFANLRGERNQEPAVSFNA